MRAIEDKVCSRCWRRFISQNATSTRVIQKAFVLASVSLISVQPIFAACSLDRVVGYKVQV
jgi:hypothetical protein